MADIFRLPSLVASFDPAVMKPNFESFRWCSCLAVLLASLGGVQASVPAEEMTTAANKFLGSLKPEQRAKAVFELKSEERLDWHYIPKDRKGLALKEMSDDQQKLALALLASGLSRQGLEKARTIMSLEPILAEMEGAGRRFPRDPALYHVLIFGKPDAKGAWSWRFEGHHISASFTLVKGEFFSSTPSFFGSNPAEVRQGPRKGLRALAGEEDAARQLVKSLDDEQRKIAVFDTTAPKEIFTEAKHKVEPLSPAGLAAAKMTAAQRESLMALVREYVRRVRPELADSDLAKIEKGGVEKVHFAWAGGLEKGDGHYYRVQGPTFLLEYDNTQNNNNHIHAVWRDFDGDFGEDILRKHYAEVPHGRE